MVYIEYLEKKSALEFFIPLIYNIVQYMNIPNMAKWERNDCQFLKK